MYILYGWKAAAETLSMGRTRLFREIANGRLRPFQNKPKVLFHREELERYASAERDRAKEASSGLRFDVSIISEDNDL